MKRNFFSSRKSQRRRGAVLVETAFVVIILLTLTLGLIQWGIIFNTTIGITNLSREGARFAAVNHETDQVIKDYITTNLPPNIKAEDLSITITPAEGSASRALGQSGTAIHVTLQYDMSKKLFLPSKIFYVTFFSGQYRADGQMMMEGSQ